MEEEREGGREVWRWGRGWGGAGAGADNSRAGMRSVEAARRRLSQPAARLNFGVWLRLAVADGDAEPRRAVRLSAFS